MDKPHAPATERNRSAILRVLEAEFGSASRVLEIGSGTGQHAVFFAQHLPHLEWQTSDRRQNHAGINAWLAEARLENLLAPIELDVLEVLELPDTAGKFDAVFSANTAHIMSVDAVRAMFSLAGRCLATDGVFCLYGPFNENGEFSSASNEQFHQSLQAQDSAMGIRDLKFLDGLAFAAGMKRVRRYAMPANNQLIVWAPGSQE